MYLWDPPLNAIDIWFSRDNLKRCSIGWSDLKGKRDNHTFWWAIFGFSGTVLIQTWPFRGAMYRGVMRVSHRFNWHHTRTIYPNGDTMLVCDWCGLAYVSKRKCYQDAICKDTGSNGDGG